MNGEGEKHNRQIHWFSAIDEGLFHSIYNDRRGTKILSHEASGNDFLQVLVLLHG